MTSSLRPFSFSICRRAFTNSRQASLFSCMTPYAPFSLSCPFVSPGAGRSALASAPRRPTSPLSPARRAGGRLGQASRADRREGELHLRPLGVHESEPPLDHPFEPSAQGSLPSRDEEVRPVPLETDIVRLFAERAVRTGGADLQSVPLRHEALPLVEERRKRAGNPLALLQADPLGGIGQDTKRQVPRLPDPSDLHALEPQGRDLLADLPEEIASAGTQGLGHAIRTVRFREFRILLPPSPRGRVEKKRRVGIPTLRYEALGRMPQPQS